jgi:hypothetical protein
VKHQVSLTITSLLALLLFTIHYAQDIVLGIEPGDTSTYIGVLIAVAWLYPVVVLAGRKSGYLINLVFALLAVLMPVLHMRGGRDSSATAAVRSRSSPPSSGCGPSSRSASPGPLPSSSRCTGW